MEVVQVPLEEIQPYWRNPRKNDAAVAPVKASIERYGMRQPLVLDVNNVIIAGHTRYRALRELGWATAPCVIAHDMPADRVREYRLVDNSTAEFAEWDMEAMIPELRAFTDMEAMQEFFPKHDLDDLLADSTGGEHKPVTQDQVDARQEKLQDQFRDASENAKSEMVTMVCPHCGEEYEVNRNEVANARN